MQRVLYNEPTNESNDEIAEINIKLSVENYNVKTLFSSSIAWIKNDNKRTFQDLESFYRRHKLNAYLIAIPTPDYITNDKNVFLKTVNGEINNDDIKYICEVVIEQFDRALELILKRHSSYENNFDCLKSSGIVDIKDMTEEEINNNKDFYMELNYNKNDILINKLQNNMIILEFKTLSPKESIEQMNDDITKLTGNKPLIKIIGKVDDTIPIMAFKDENGKLLSHIGWTIKKVDDEFIYNLINLQDHLYKN
jgi:hypothetical protein